MGLAHPTSGCGLWLHSWELSLCQHKSLVNVLVPDARVTVGQPHREHYPNEDNLSKSKGDTSGVVHEHKKVPCTSLSQKSISLSHCLTVVVVVAVYIMDKLSSL